MARAKKPEPPKRPTGRPTLRSPEVIAAILTSLAIGNTREDSSLAAGISPSTLRLWCHQDDALSAQVEKAEAQARQRMVGVVVKAASEGTWTAAMTFLERRDPEHWARRDRLDLAIDVRKEAAKIAAEHDLSLDDVLAEVDRIIGARQ